jgi:hypothetical protein
MKMTWIWENAPSLIAFIVGLGFVGVSFLDAQYRYLYVLLAILAFYYGYRRFGRKETPFERKEREMRNHFRS